jgi:hypothetical protein
MESILDTIKQMLGPSAEDPHFDPEIITHINSVLMDLNQMGVGPADGFVVEDSTDKWSDFVQEELWGKLEAIKSYIYLRVKLLFDISSLGSATIASYERQIEKSEWRITEAVELAKAQ